MTNIKYASQLCKMYIIWGVWYQHCSDAQSWTNDIVTRVGEVREALEAGLYKRHSTLTGQDWFYFCRSIFLSHSVGINYLRLLFWHQYGTNVTLRKSFSGTVQGVFNPDSWSQADLFDTFFIQITFTIIPIWAQRQLGTSTATGRGAQRAEKWIGRVGWAAWLLVRAALQLLWVSCCKIMRRRRLQSSMGSAIVGAAQ